MLEKLKIKEIYNDFKSKIILTDTQDTILELLLKDKSITQISMEMCICERTFNANVTSDTAGSVAIALKTATGTDVEGTESDVVIATAGEYTNVSFTKLLKICPRVNTTIAVGSIPAIGGVTPAVTTEIPTIKDANLIIRKIA